MRSLITVEDLAVEFPVKQGGRHTVFSGLNLQIEEGEFVCVVGQTGCGKSTLLKLLLGSEKPAAGSITIDGKAVMQPGRERGYVPQKYSLFPDKTVLQNIAFGPVAESFALHRLLQPSWWANRRQIYREAGSYLQQVGLQERDGRKYPEQLSGGMQQRVAIAQSLILRPRILLMDESFSALDPGTRTSMQRFLRDLWRESGTTILFVTHNIPEAIFLGSRILLIAKDEAGDCSRIALDLQVPDYIRQPDGYPKADELERLRCRLESAALHHHLEEEMAEFGG